ncbi:hypothetical protein [Gluconobacter morbifer]|uniref:hypothetical protein n=1 Tax=Gluconobacter morbifer TaxID=479935 RepID=UPI00058AF9F7|nr:hypothetical protein [Gluconobacter morbifer]
MIQIEQEMIERFDQRDKAKDKVRWTKSRNADYQKFCSDSWGAEECDAIYLESETEFLDILLLKTSFFSYQ